MKVHELIAKLNELKKHYWSLFVMKPFFKHDCGSCTYIGSAIVNNKKADIYACSCINQAPREIILIWRHGNEPSDYGSMPQDLIQSHLGVWPSLAKSMWLKHIGVNGYGDGSYFKDDKVVL